MRQFCGAAVIVSGSGVNLPEGKLLHHVTVYAWQAEFLNHHYSLWQGSLAVDRDFYTKPQTCSSTMVPLLHYRWGEEGWYTYRYRGKKSKVGWKLIYKNALGLQNNLLRPHSCLLGKVLVQVCQLICVYQLGVFLLVAKVQKSIVFRK